MTDPLDLKIVASPEIPYEALAELAVHEGIPPDNIEFSEYCPPDRAFILDIDAITGWP